MPFNILRNATIRNDMGCRHDNNDGWAVVWDENDDYKQYNDISGITSTVVWDKTYVSVATSGTCYIGPTQDQAPIDALVYGFIKVTYRIEPNPASPIVPTLGKIQFQTNDDPTYDDDKVVTFPVDANNAYNEYVIDMSAIREWNGLITRLRLFPFLDGFPGSIIHLKSIRVQSKSVFSCDTAFNGTLCDKFSQYSHPCPWVGAGGYSKGAVVNDGLSISPGVNDKLVVNINGYGEQGISLSPTNSARLKSVALDIEEKLSNIAIGGYAGCKVDVSFGQITISADDTRESSSTVHVVDSPAARMLGFYNSSGVMTSEEVAGVQAASRYEPAGSLQLSKSQISHLYRSDPAAVASSIDLDVTRFAVQAGRSDFSLVFKDIKVDFLSKTIIDFNNPVSNNGILTYFAYSGDGFSSTQMRVFRPLSDGRIKHVASVSMGISGSPEDKVFEATASVRVRKGDFIGIYNGRLDAGKLEELPDQSYFIYNGNLKDGATTSSLVPLEGRGQRGLRLFAHGKDTESQVVLDIQFEQQELIEELTVFAEEESRTEEINLTHVLAGGLGGGVYVNASTGKDKFGNQAPPLVDLEALFDAVSVPLPNADTTHPSWLDTTVVPPDKFDQTDFTISLDFASGVDVFFSINRMKIYFRDPDNVKYFAIEYPLTTDLSNTQQYFGPVKHTDVFLEGKLLEPKDHPIYTNPIHPTVENFVDSYQVLQYRTVEFRFEPVRARSIRYVAKNYYFDDVVFKKTLSNFVVAPSAHILEMEVFAASTPVSSIADNFSFESSVDGENYVLHNSYIGAGQTSARFLIGYPVHHLKFKISPQGKLHLRSLGATTSRSQTRIKANSNDGVLSLNIASNDFSSYETLKVTNNSNSTYNYFVDLSSQRNSVERCILWNKLSSAQDLETSEMGPSPSVQKRADYFLREYNHSLGVPGYIIDPFWLLNNNVTSYISYNHGSTWESRGNILSDYTKETFLEATNSLADDFLFTYIVVDLGKVYDLDTVQIFGLTGRTLFDGPLYSNKDVSDPSLLDIIDDFTGVKGDARWLRFRAFAKLPGSTGIAAIAYIQISFDAVSGRNIEKLPWVKVDYLTNYNFTSSELDCGEGWHCPETGFNNWYAIDLEKYYNITNIVTGPSSPFLSDIDLIQPGDQGSVYTETSKANTSIAYGISNTSNPKNVQWGSLGASPTSRTRWILFKKADKILEEVMVHVDGNDQSTKAPFRSARWWTAELGTVVEDYAEYLEGTNSISITYSKNSGPSLETIETNQSFGIDHELEERDELRVLIHFSDPSQIDFSKGFVTLGRYTDEDNQSLDPLADAEKDEVNYFQWPLSDIAPFATSGWNEVFLPFSDNYRVGKPYFEEDDVSLLSHTSISGRSRFRWFQVSFCGKENNKEFSIKLNGLKVVRANFTAGFFGDALYLAGEEYARFPVHNFNLLEGTIEFYLNPDWSKDPGCLTCEDPREHTIFRIFTTDGAMIGVYMSGHGLRVYLTDGKKHFFLTDSSAVPIPRGQNVHFALTWDLLGRKGSQALTVYLDNVLSSTFEVEALASAEFKDNPNATLVLGGLGWEGISEKRATSVNGTIENLKLYNYVKNDFSFNLVNQGLESIVPSEELVELSVDGVNFYGSQDRSNGFPILLRNVGPGQSFNVHVRNKDNGSILPKVGQERTAYIEILRSLAG